MFRDSSGSVVERTGSETAIPKVAGLNQILSEILLIRGLFLLSISLRLLFFCVPACLRSTASPLCLKQNYKKFLKRTNDSALEGQDFLISAKCFAELHIKSKFR